MKAIFALFLISLALVYLSPLASSAPATSGTMCTGQVQQYRFDLSGLAAALNYSKVSTLPDSHGNLYTYQVCNVTSACSSAQLPAALCQEVVTGRFLAIGQTTHAEWSALPGDNGSNGFRLTFLGGYQDRMAVISFKCSPFVGVGKFTFASESPMLTYNFEWATQYACPIMPTPSQTPPIKGDLCCLYRETGQQKLRTLCTLPPANCHPSFENFTLIDSWPVPSCDGCFFDKKK